MTAHLAPDARFTASYNGEPVANGQLYTYEAGTLTPLATYTDYAGVSANTNPVILNAQGQAVVRLSQTQAYKFVLKDADNVTLWTEDNVQGFVGSAELDGPLGADKVGFDLTETYSPGTVGFQLSYLYTPAGFVTSSMFIGDGGRSLAHTSDLEGYYNFGAGFRCLTNITTGSYNTFGGFEAGEDITTGSYNTGFGEACGIYNVTGNFNTYGGWKAGQGKPSSHVSASYNTWYGAAAGLLADTGDSNTGIGAYTMQATGMVGAGNSTLGRQALSLLTTGNYNSVGGYLAAQAATTASNNALWGYSIAFSLTTGSHNAMLGDTAGYELTTGSYNTFIGSNTGRGITTGGKNTIVGANVLGLAAGLSNNVILADGDGAIRAQHNATNWNFCPGVAVPAGGSTTMGITASSTANFGVFFGSGAPTLTAAKGSLYLRTDGSTTNNRMYINTDSGSTWTAVTTAA